MFHIKFHQYRQSDFSGKVENIFQDGRQIGHFVFQMISRHPSNSVEEVVEMATATPILITGSSLF